MQSFDRAKGEILDRLLRYVAVGGILAYVPSLAASLYAGLWVLAVLDTVVYAIFIALSFSRRPAFGLKIVMLVTCGIGIGAAVLFQTGRDGAGYVWLIFGIVVSALFGRKRVIVAAMAASAAVLAAYAAAAALGFLPFEQPLMPLLVIASNLALICGVLAYVIVRLDGGLRAALAERSEMARTLGVELAAAKDARTKLARSLETKEILLRELEHRVRNNIQVITSLARLEAERGGVREGRGGAAGADGLASVLRKIRAVSIVNDLFLADPESPSIELADMARSVAARAHEEGPVSGAGIGVGEFSYPVVVRDAVGLCVAAAELLDALRESGCPSDIVLEEDSSGKRLALRLPEGYPLAAAEAAAARASADPTIRGMLPEGSIAVAARQGLGPVVSIALP